MSQYGAVQMAASWRTVRKNTVQIAQDIPAEQYDYRAAPDTMSVAEMLAHLATSTLWAEQAHFAERRDAITPEIARAYLGEAEKVAATLTTKETIIEALTTHGESFANNLATISDEQLATSVALPAGDKLRIELLLGVKEHEMHHRAQLMLIERMLGIVPHVTRARQART